MFLGIEIGGTKLQFGIGRGDGSIHGLWRGEVDPDAGANGILQQLARNVPVFLTSVESSEIHGIGVGYGGPTDDEAQTVIKSHHIAGWDGFPLAAWLRETFGYPAVICNDADVAGLAEARYGAGKGLSPVFYITVGTGIGGGLVIDGEIYRGVGKGASEIGHLLVPSPDDPTTTVILEAVAAGWGLEARAARQSAESGEDPPTAKALAAAARAGNVDAVRLFDAATTTLAFAIRQVITLLCPRRIVIGGGVSLAGEELFFNPLRRKIADQAFAALAGLTDIVPAALGEEVVVHGALALARQKFGG